VAGFIAVWRRHFFGAGQNQPTEEVMKRLVVIAVFLAALAAPAFAQEAPEKPETKPIVERIEQRLAKLPAVRLIWSEMTPEQRQAARENVRPKLEKFIEQNRGKWRDMTPEQRQTVRKRLRKQALQTMWKELTPEQKQNVRDKIKDLRQERRQGRGNPDRS
jgi:predicted Fe-S protein YdhL (DUF1289 family)